MSEVLRLGCSTQRAAVTPCGTVHCVQLSANCPQLLRASVMGASIQQARAGRIERAVWASPVTNLRTAAVTIRLESQWPWRPWKGRSLQNGFARNPFRPTESLNSLQ
jgi:hypothetical protein